MKLQNELEFVTYRFKNIRGLENYAKQLKESKNYNDFETRLAWDCLRHTVPTDVICGWYDKYNCNDKHITTLAKMALREVYKG